MIFVIRNNQQFGPYDNNVLLNYVENGKILLRDRAFIQNSPNDIKTVGYFFKQSGVKVNIKNNGSLFSQILVIGRELILPNSVFDRRVWFKDKKLIFLAIIGLAPAFLIRFTFASYFTFYAIALYFSIIWALFFYYLFQTKQVTIKFSIIVFFLTQVFVLMFVNIQALPGFSSLYSLTHSNSIVLRLIGFVFGVGILEESIKALPLLAIVKRANEPTIPQTLVYYGLISGIGFGVLEGVQYQTTVNSELGYNEAFFMNVARLTCLPFLHAIWSAIAGYYISFADLYPRYRISLYFLAIAIPATLHGLYNTFTWSFIGLFFTLIAVILLINYLKKGIDFQSKLTN